MIIQLRAAIFERIWNVQIQALQTVFICLLSLPFLCIFYLWFKHYRRWVVYNDVKRDFATCSLTLRHVTENHYVKCPVHFFGWNIFHLLSYEQNLLTNRIAGKLMNIKKIKLLNHEKMCIKSEVEEILFKLATNEWSDISVNIKTLSPGGCLPQLWGYIHVLNHKKMFKIGFQRDFFETCSKWLKWKGLSVDIKILSPGGSLPLPRGYIHVLNHENIV